MKKFVAQELQRRSAFVAELFSKKDRPLNTTGESFSVDTITVLSETTAAVTFRKDTGKFAMAFFFYLHTDSGRWEYFFPTDSHLLGMGLMCQAKQLIEHANYGFNFGENDNI
jgi:hypothetical protein